MASIALDEISPFAKTYIVELKDKKINEFDQIQDIANEIEISNSIEVFVKYKANKIIEIFNLIDKKISSKAVCLNAAAGLIVAGKDNDYKKHYFSALNKIDYLKVYMHLNKIQLS